MTTRIVTDANGRNHITNEPLLHPPKRTWVGLTDEEIDDLAEFHGLDYMSYAPFTRAIEDKLEEKNT